jgi:hypothetical protein
LKNKERFLKQSNDFIGKNRLINFFSVCLAGSAECRKLNENLVEFNDILKENLTADNQA